MNQMVPSFDFLNHENVDVHYHFLDSQGRQISNPDRYYWYGCEYRHTQKVKREGQLKELKQSLIEFSKSLPSKISGEVVKIQVSNEDASDDEGSDYQEDPFVCTSGVDTDKHEPDEDPKEEDEFTKRPVLKEGHEITCDEAFKDWERLFKRVPEDFTFVIKTGDEQ